MRFSFIAASHGRIVLQRNERQLKSNHLTFKSFCFHIVVVYYEQGAVQCSAFFSKDTICDAANAEKDDVPEIGVISTSNEPQANNPQNFGTTAQSVPGTIGHSTCLCETTQIHCIFQKTDVGLP